MKHALGTGVAALAAVLALAACGDGDVASGSPATGDAVARYSRNITDVVKLGEDADLVQLFCVNTTAAACPPDIAARLSQYGFTDGGNGVDLAHAFAAMAADATDGEADQISSDADFLAAAYRVVLARDPDAGGAQTNLAFIKDTGQRKTMLRSMLESEEFRSR